MKTIGIILMVVGGLMLFALTLGSIGISFFQKGYIGDPWLVWVIFVVFGLLMFFHPKTKNDNENGGLLFIVGQVILYCVTEMFQKDSRIAHYIWFALSAITFLLASFFAGNNLLVAYPLTIIACLFFTIGKNHRDAQKFIRTEKFDSFWAYRHNWSKYRIYWLYLVLFLLWVAVFIGKMVKALEVVR